MSTTDHLFRIANRLGKVPAGSLAADEAVHEALGLAGPVLRYTRDDTVARGLVPAGFEWMDLVHSAGAVYAACRRSGMDGDLQHPHHGSWAATLPLAMCATLVRVHAALVGMR